MSAAHTPYVSTESSVEDGPVSLMLPSSVGVGGSWTDRVRYWLITSLAGPDFILLNAKGTADRINVQVGATQRVFARNSSAITLNVDPDVLDRIHADVARRKATTAVEPNSVGTPQGVGQK